MFSHIFNNLKEYIISLIYLFLIFLKIAFHFGIWDKKIQTNIKEIEMFKSKRYPRYSPVKFILQSLLLLFIVSNDVLVFIVKKIKIDFLERAIEKLSDKQMAITFYIVKVIEFSLTISTIVLGFYGEILLASQLSSINLALTFVSSNMILFGWNKLRKDRLFKWLSDKAIRIKEELMNTKIYADLLSKYEEVKQKIFRTQKKAYGFEKIPLWNKKRSFILSYGKKPESLEKIQK